MNEFLEKLYSYEYFGTYLMIAIIVLLLLFVIILFFGKKDQKNREIEATKKLQQINSEDAFKENSVPQSVEVNTLGSQNLNDTIVVPNLGDLNPNDIAKSQSINPEESVDTLNVEPQPVNNEVNMNDVSNPSPEISQSPVLEPVNSYEPPIFNPTPNPVPNSVPEAPTSNSVDNFANSNNEISNNIPPIAEPEAPIENPVFNIPDNRPNTNVNIQDVNVNPNQEFYNSINQELNNETKPILDRVEEKPFAFGPTKDPINVNNAFAPKEEPTYNFNNAFNNNSNNNGFSSESDVEIPQFNFDEIVRGIEETKKEPTPTVNKGSEVFSSVYVPEKEEFTEPKIVKPEIKEVKETPKSNDDMDLELPTLKKESTETIEKPVLNDFNLDDLSGETYMINK